MNTETLEQKEVDYLGSATYSPEDNKLRLYPFSRLDRETYERVRSEGFIWAPKQELFVAPMWTPGREDLLIELCGEINDEDKSLVDRAEERSERFEDYSEKRADDARAAKEAVSAIKIPFGQPILVGHHSEKRARKDADRIESGMRKAVKMWETSKYWADRAAGAIRAAKYKELPSVRARRIKKIEAEKRKIERAKAQHESCIRFWSGKFNFVNRETGEKRPIEIIESNKESICKVIGGSHELSGLTAIQVDGHNWSAWNVLQSDDERYKACPSMTVAQVQERAMVFYPKMIANCNRWIAHFENRLTYERAMLGEQGGIATDRVLPEKGGACKCWCSPRGGWLIIQKVNKVSVSVLDNWGNGGEDFTRTIEFDKLSSLWSKAQVDQARADGRLIGETKRGFILANEKPRTFQPEEPSAEDAEFKALRETAKAGVQVVTAPQLFPTPPEIAKQVVELAEIITGQRVLEPSAGTGNLAVAVLEEVGSLEPEIVCVEINFVLSKTLNAQGFNCRHADFLQCNGDLGKFDRIVMNPPFENGADIKHIEHARTFLKPGGKLVAICANGPRQREALEPIADTWIDLPEGSFKDQGTNVRTAIVVISSQS